MKSITLKLILSFIAIGLVSIFIIILLARRNTRDEFTRFISEDRGEELISELANYHETNGSWEGVRDAFSEDNDGKRYPSFTIADDNGHALFDGGGFRVGDEIPRHELRFGVPIESNGQIVGTLVMENSPFPGTPREEEFIKRVNILFLYSGLGAALIALFIGALLSRRKTRPFRLPRQPAP